MRKIAVTGTGSLIGQGILKSIFNSKVKNKVEVIGYDYFKDTVGSFWLNKNYVLPDILKEEVSEKHWVDFLIKSFKDENIELVLIGLDFELELFSKNKELIESKTKAKIIVSDVNKIRIANDKYLTYKFLRKGKFHYPKTTILSNTLPKNISFPIVVKPRTGYRSRNVFIVNDLNHLNKLEIKNKTDFILQEYLSNENEEYTCGTLTFGNTIKTIILKRKLKDGNTFIGEHSEKRLPQIEEYIYEVNKALIPFGPCNFQLRIDKDGNPKIFEINLRFSGTTYMRSLFGFNEVEYIICKSLFDIDRTFYLKYGTAIRYYEEKLV